jgi:purine-nucleoside phosphorylase
LPALAVMNPSTNHATVQAADVLRSRWTALPTVGIITGSGFRYQPGNGGAIETISYTDLPGLHSSTVAGHNSQVALLDVDGCSAVLCSGRLHPYEGHSETLCMQLVTLLHAIGVTTLLVTNAAGGLHWRYSPGDIALITDTIDLTFLREPSPSVLAEASSNMNNAISTLSVLEHCSSQHLALETGTYCQVLGPSYETRAEIRMLRRLGADLVGMSTARELRLARRLGMNAIGFSMVTNTLTDSQSRSVTHAEVLDVASAAGAHLSSIIDATIRLTVS